MGHDMKQMLYEVATGLVDNFKASLRWASVQALALAGFVQLAWIGMPIEAKDLFPETTGNWIAFLSYLGIYLARVKSPKAGT